MTQNTESQPQQARYFGRVYGESGVDFARRTLKGMVTLITEPTS